MKEGLKIFGLGIGSILVLIALVFGGGAVSILYYKVYAPMYKNVERNVFEESQSFVQGKVNDLAKYYEEYNATEDATDRAAIKQLVIMNFSQFEADNVRVDKLRQFLISMRGY